jgi:alpha-tubulin suppressor-like RCC1 family protein
LGDGTTVNRYIAVYVRKLTRIVAVQAGEEITCALTDAAEVKCWGNAGSGVLGRPQCKDSGNYCSEPVLVTGFSGRVIGLSVGNTHACAVMETGGIVCWGSNAHGQLGDGTTENRSIPVEVSGFEGAAEPTGLPPLGPKLPTSTPTHKQ